MTRPYLLDAVLIIDAMAKCHALHSFDTCHHALNR